MPQSMPMEEPDMNESPKKKAIAGPPLNIKRGLIELSHGSGGVATSQLIEALFLPAFDNPMLAAGNDQACFDLPPGRVVMSTDSYVISPLFFPGGDIGSLAVHGTINDLAMAGAKPLYLSVGLILEEGFALADLQRIIHSMAQAAQQAGVKIVTGDTKVVERGKGDGLFINTTGVGVVPADLHIAASQVRIGDHILINGSMGDHGIAVMSQRNHLDYLTDLTSDSAALHELVAEMLLIKDAIHCLRDPTRGGVATVLNEVARQAGLGMLIQEEQVPVKPAVQGACELLGLDPFYVANEGKLVAFCDPTCSQDLLAQMRRHPLGRDAAIIGEVIADPRAFVQLETCMGGRRVMDSLYGEQLPRIC